MTPRACWSWRTPLVLSTLVLSVLSALRAQHEPLDTDRGHVGLGLALRRLENVRSLLYVTAHPDDEDSALLVKLSRGLGIRTSVLTLTRGEGGQNEIGSELFDAIGVLRTEELLAAHRMDGVEQFFGRVVDFGYSFSVEETFAQWDYDATKEDVARVVREFRPDVIVTLFPRGAGGGQHHQASARIAADVFRSVPAGEPRPKKMYRAHWGELRSGYEDVALAVGLGDFDPLLGMTYAEFGALARNRHRCQGMNAPPVPGSTSRWYSLAETVLESAPNERDFFAGVPQSLAERYEAAGMAVPASVATWRERAVAARSAFRRREYSEVERQALLALAEPDRDTTGDTATSRREDLARLSNDERLDWLAVAVKAGFVHAVARVVDRDDGLAARGERVLVEVEFAHRAAARVELESVRIEALTGELERRVVATSETRVELGSGDVARHTFSLAVPGDTPLTQPFWWRDGLDEGRYQTRGLVDPAVAARLPDDAFHRARRIHGLEHDDVRGRPHAPFLPPALVAVWRYRRPDVAESKPIEVARPVVFRWFDPDLGARRSYALKVVPPVVVDLEPRLLVVPEQEAAVRDVAVSVQSFATAPEPIDVMLDAPPGWTVTPARVAVGLARGERRTVAFRVIPAADAALGRHTLDARARRAGVEYEQGFQSIAYHHVETRHLFRPATLEVVVADIDMQPGLRVGYVDGVGDQVKPALQQLGVDTVVLSDDALARGELSFFHAIVLGVRAYKSRTALIANNQRLLDYVEAGGTLVVQYNKYEFNRAQYGPYPARIHRPHDRVTDQDARVHVLDADHPVFTTPHRIGAADWQGWVQERGLYFWREWDPHYTPLLELSDSFEYNRGQKRGSLLVARFGKGFYVYTGLSLFRQLPAGVPGAYRLLGNLISLGLAAR